MGQHPVLLCPRALARGAAWVKRARGRSGRHHRLGGCLLRRTRKSGGSVKPVGERAVVVLVVAAAVVVLWGGADGTLVAVVGMG